MNKRSLNRVKTNEALVSAWISQTTATYDEQTSARISLMGTALIADRSGALYWPDEAMLIVSDLHLEKGSSFARFRQHLPPYDTMATLQQLSLMMGTYNPKRVLCLGDSVHDRAAWDRLSNEDRARLVGLCQSVEDWIWIAGNHDPDPPAGVPGTSLDTLRLQNITFRHEPGGELAEDEGEVAGHLHPAARVIGKGGSTRRPAFAHDGTRLIMPAFGAYAGGLCLSAQPFKSLFERSTFKASVCGRSRVFTVPGNRILGWR
ncbi:MAG: ligase-associated DNA damage response endonuclease PdeM [Pseudomonadota bacterium]